MLAPTARLAITENEGARFSFAKACEHLSLDPEYLRSGLRRRRESQPARAHSPLLRRRGGTCTRGSARPQSCVASREVTPWNVR
jgi:hypothetical protein